MATQSSLSASDEIFIAARDSFVSSLSDAERAQLRNCSSINALLDTIRGLGHLAKSRRRLEPCFKKIKSFGDNLAPYFKVIEIFCAAHPEWANIALGALRLILEVKTDSLLSTAPGFTPF
jgi:hypothetical protein